MYKVIRYFRDAQDNEHAYNAGDVFPRKGMNVSQQRISDLLNGNNFQQVPLIEFVPGEVKTSKAESKAESKESEDESKEITKEEIEKMPFFKLKSVAKGFGIDVKDKKADEIKAELMEKL